ncbi:hypothetical protein BHE74_00042872 [Ensete ventricosum]|nr:hypothetical protein BHE74_00042872 [Ensete ventricosum]RZR86258.1 hypothetical protein BHM03_00013418 [Ensete ventricosum]
MIAGPYSLLNGWTKTPGSASLGPAQMICTGPSEPYAKSGLQSTYKDRPRGPQNRADLVVFALALGRSTPPRILPRGERKVCDPSSSSGFSTLLASVKLDSILFSWFSVIILCFVFLMLRRIPPSNYCLLRLRCTGLNSEEAFE